MIELWGYSFRWLNILDLLIVIFLIYELYRLVKGSIAFKIFGGVLIIYLVYFLVRALRMPLLTSILQNFINVGILAIIIIFQPEIRRFLLLLGKNIPFSEDNIWRRLIMPTKKKESEKQEKIIKHLIMAVGNLANTYTGALIVLSKEVDASSGVLINGEISGRLLESIFRKNGPLHDGAVVINNDKIIAAKVVLPVSDNPNLPTRIGLRHRSGVGATEQTDALSVIVSEERGNVSIAQSGRLYMNVSLEELKAKLKKVLIEKEY